MGVSLGPAGIVGYGSGVTSIIVLSKSHRKWTTSNHAGGFNSWRDAGHGTHTHVKRATSSTLAITAHLFWRKSWLFRCQVKNYCS